VLRWRRGEAAPTMGAAGYGDGKPSSPPPIVGESLNRALALGLVYVLLCVL
jgi:hypothetical protein